MPAWLRQLLYGTILICSGIIGYRVYLETTVVESAGKVLPPAEIPDTLPDFSLNDIWGERRSITEWVGQPLLLNFWGTWCAPCRREMPLLQALHISQDELQVLGIAIDREADARNYMAEAGISYPSLVGEADAMAVADLFGPGGLGLPFTVLVDSRRQILALFIGEISAAQLEQMVDVARQHERGEITTDAARALLAQR